jgi:hypothetical protein
MLPKMVSKRVLCACANIQVPKREEMEQLRDAWIKELGSVPPGNAEQCEKWASTVGEAARWQCHLMNVTHTRRKNSKCVKRSLTQT